MTSAFDEYTAQSDYSDPGRYAALLDDLPGDPARLTAAVRNLVIHYRSGGVAFTGERLAEIDHRWIQSLLATDQGRNRTPLTSPREPLDRVVGCCRDFTLLTVSALRQRGIPARSRVGFVPYLTPRFNHDHVVVEYWNGRRWIVADAMLDPAGRWDIAPGDLARTAWRTAAEVWTGLRHRELDGDAFGVAPQSPIRGDWFVRNYVFHELAHRRRDELLLWDSWGAMSGGPDGDPDGDAAGDLALTDEIAAELLAADAGDAGADRALADRYREDPRLCPDRWVLSFSPAAADPVLVDLRTRAPIHSGHQG